MPPLFGAAVRGVQVPFIHFLWPLVLMGLTRTATENPRGYVVSVLTRSLIQEVDESIECLLEDLLQVWFYYMCTLALYR